LTNARASDSGTYFLTARNQFGGDISSNAVLTILDAAPSFVLQPSNMLRFVHSNATMQALAAGSLPMSLQWRLNGADVPNATNSALILTNLQTTNSGTYTLFASNSFDVAISSNAVLTVTTTNDLGVALNATNLSWTPSPAGSWFAETSQSHDGMAAAQSYCTGSYTYRTQALATYVTGPGMLSFWWEGVGQFDNFGFSAISSAPSNSFTNRITGVSGWQQVSYDLPAGSYTLTWQYASSTYWSPHANNGWLDQVTFTPGVFPTTTVTGLSNMTVAAGSSPYLAVSADGTPPLNYQWSYNGADLQGATNSSLSLMDVQAQSQGTYAVLVSNPLGSGAASSFLTVTDAAPTIVTQPIHQAMIPGGATSFSVTARGTEPFTYQWQFNAAPVTGAKASILSLAAIDYTNAGSYSVVVSNSVGSTVSSNAILTVAPTVVVAWGDNYYGESIVPPGLTNAVAVASGQQLNLILKGDGSAVGIGFNIWVRLPSHPASPMPSPSPPTCGTALLCVPMEPASPGAIMDGVKRTSPSAPPTLSPLLAPRSPTLLSAPTARSLVGAVLALEFLTSPRVTMPLRLPAEMSSASL